MPDSISDQDLYWHLKRAIDLSLEKILFSNHLKCEIVLNSVGSASHKLNQPLQVALGKVELLLLDSAAETQLVQDLKVIRSQILLAAEINQKIERLVNFKKE